jgi:hypothetical protein
MKKNENFLIDFSDKYWTRYYKIMLYFNLLKHALKGIIFVAEVLLIRF